MVAEGSIGVKSYRRVDGGWIVGFGPAAVAMRLRAENARVGVLFSSDSVACCCVDIPKED